MGSIVLCDIPNNVATCVSEGGGTIQGRRRIAVYVNVGQVPTDVDFSYTLERVG